MFSLKRDLVNFRENLVIHIFPVHIYIPNMPSSSIPENSLLPTSFLDKRFN